MQHGLIIVQFKAVSCLPETDWHQTCRVEEWGRQNPICLNYLLVATSTIRIQHYQVFISKSNFCQIPINFKAMLFALWETSSEKIVFDIFLLRQRIVEKATTLQLLWEKFVGFFQIQNWQLFLTRRKVWNGWGRAIHLDWQMMITNIDVIRTYSVIYRNQNCYWSLNDIKLKAILLDSCEELFSNLAKVWKFEVEKRELTPTWFEHAAFWSGVRRATVAPRSPLPSITPSLGQRWSSIDFYNANFGSTVKLYCLP